MVKWLLIISRLLVIDLIRTFGSVKSYTLGALLRSGIINPRPLCEIFIILFLGYLDIENR